MIEDIDDLINVNDEFYVCKNCEITRWDNILDLLFKDKREFDSKYIRS